MYKAIGVGLLSLFVLMVLPANATDELSPIFYGSATMVLADSEGNQLLTQTVHNRITNAGETFIINQVFDTTATAVAGDKRIGAICISGAADTAFAEGVVDTLAHGFAATGTGSDGNHCKVTENITATAGTTSTAATATTTFASGTNVVTGDIIKGILICAKNNAATTDFLNCNTPADSVVFAAIDLTDVTMSGTDTVTIQYTFDITTANT